MPQFISYNNPDYYGSGYTGSDIKAVFRFPEFIDASPIPFGELSIISYSTYRDKFPVRAIGYTRAKGYTKGARTVAGTLVFNLLNKAAVNKFIKELYPEDVWESLSVVMDELPPFSIDISFCNEVGNKTNITLIGVEIAEGNQVMSVNNMSVNEQYSFVAQDVTQVDL